MNVMMLAPGNSPHTQRVIKMLLGEGCSVTCVSEINPLPQKLPAYEFVPLPRVRGVRFRWFREHFEARVRGWQLRRLWSRLRPDVVNVQWCDIRAEACVRGGLRPLVLSAWGSDINQPFLSASRAGAGRTPLGAALAKADFITADSPEVLQRCELLAGAAVPARLFFFGVDPNLFKPGYRAESLALRRELGIADDDKIILSPRRLQPLLGQRHILQAMADCGVENAVVIFRTYLSSDSSYEMELRRLAESLGLERRVFWLGESAYDTVPSYYALADWVVNYPEQDAFPVSLLEAAMCRRPVVTSRLPAYEGVFGDAFVTVPPADPAALAEAFRRCLTESAAVTDERVDRARAIALAIGDQQKSIQVLMDIFRIVSSPKADYGRTREN